jgi:transcription-repair coupling factor (superfamily II helicase)
MALLGLRDISNLGTPPLERQSVATCVLPADDAFVAKALKKELLRGGQSFVLHNRVKSLETRTRQIQSLLPEARVAFAHGQMKAGELEKVMFSFLCHDIDVLVCSTIISNGLDISNANTILIDDAHRFGLAELHQIRGRVGRGESKAYAYLFLPRQKSLNEKAKKRLQALEEYSELGSGFQIAMRDLEIRGAGNIIGAEQSGHIISVGYELYCQLLEHAVEKQGLKKSTEPPDEERVDIPLAAYLPEAWLGSRQEKITALKELLASKTLNGIQKLEDEFRDRFGIFPGEFQCFIDVLKLKLHLRKLSVKAISLFDKGVILHGQKIAPLQKKLKPYPGRIWVEEGKKIFLSPYRKGLSGKEHLEMLLNVFGAEK